MSFEQDMKNSFRIKKAFTNYNVVLAFLPILMDNKITEGISFNQGFEFLISRLPIKTTSKQLGSTMGSIKDKYNARYKLDMQNFEDLALYLFSSESKLLKDSHKALKIIHETEKFLSSLPEDKYKLFMKSSLGVKDDEMIMFYRELLSNGIIPESIATSQKPGILWNKLSANKTSKKVKKTVAPIALTTRPEKVIVQEVAPQSVRQEVAPKVIQEDNKGDATEELVQEIEGRDDGITENDAVEHSNPEDYALTENSIKRRENSRMETTEGVEKKLVRLSEMSEQRDRSNKEIFKGLTGGMLSVPPLKSGNLMQDNGSDDGGVDGFLTNLVNVGAKHEV